MAERIVYVYGIVPATLDVGGAPAGLEDAPVEVERDGELAALVSRLDGEAYASGVIEPRLGDLTWLGPRAAAHDRVVTWASDAGPIVPLKMFTLFSDTDALRARIQSRAEGLRGVLARVSGAHEYALRVFRMEKLLLERVGALSARVAELERQAGAAPPGQRYLLLRKVDGERRSEADRVAAEVARATYGALEALALAAVREPVPRRQPETVEGMAVLNAFFLVAHQALQTFQRTVTELVRRHEENGFRFEFTGPWPPYHFVGDAGAGV